jgi:hypothetical protein
VLRAPEDAMPATHASSGQLATQVVGTQTGDQGLFDAAARCGIGPGDVCEVVAKLRNEGSARRVDGYDVLIGGKRVRTLRVAVAARSTAKIVLLAPPASLVELRLSGHDALALDDTAWVSVPSTANGPALTTVTLVGDPTGALPVAQALAAIPGVRLELRTAQRYRRSDALASDLVVVDGSLPGGGLPPSPAVLLVAPPRLPGGAVTGTSSASSVTSTAPGAELLDGVDLGSLSIDAGAAERLTLPDWVSPLASSADGPLLAAGDNGRQRLAVLAFDPARSNITQLAAFPILARNIVRWAREWASVSDDGSVLIDAVPATTSATLAARAGGSQRRVLGASPAGFAGVAPGAYTASAAGGGVRHQRGLTSVLAAPETVASAATGSPIDLSSWTSAPLPRERDSLVPWLIVLALLAMAGDWICWRRLRQ